MQGPAVHMHRICMLNSFMAKGVVCFLPSRRARCPVFSDMLTGHVCTGASIPAGHVAVYVLRSALLPKEVAGPGRHGPPQAPQAQHVQHLRTPHAPRLPAAALPGHAAVITRRCWPPGRCHMACTAPPAMHCPCRPAPPRPAADGGACQRRTRRQSRRWRC